jgi:uncharacterized membrane protein
MENLFGLALLVLLDVAPDPVHPISWGALIVLLVIVFALAVSFTAGLVFVLIWFKRRRKAGST